MLSNQMLDLSVDVKTARRVLRCIGEAGQPPERCARVLNVGTQSLLEGLRSEYLEPIKNQEAHAAVKFVKAPYGGGKTLLVNSVREEAWDLGYHTAVVPLSAKECPLDEAAMVYRSIASQLQAPPVSHDDQGDRGIDAVLRLEVETRAEELGVAEVAQWLDSEFARSRVDSHSFRRAAQLFMKAVLANDFEKIALLASYLRGEAVPPAELHAFGVRQSLTPRTGFEMLKSLIQVLRALDAPGVFIAFDEMDRMLTIPPRRRRAVGETIRALIDLSGHAALSGLFCLFAVPPEFMTEIVSEYPALEQRLRTPATFSKVTPLAPVIDLDGLDLRGAKGLARIGERLLLLYFRAFSGLDATLQAEHIRKIAERIGESSLETGSMRTFVKAVVNLLDEQRLGGEHALDDDGVTNAVKGAAEALPSLDDDDDHEVIVHGADDDDDERDELAASAEEDLS